jgi:hypothetical protein
MNLDEWPDKRRGALLIVVAVVIFWGLVAMLVY